MSEVKVLLTGDITGARDGQPWPPAGTVVSLPEDEAQSLVHSGMAKSTDGTEATVKLAEAARTVLDEVTSAQVTNATTTRERQAVSKRSHEPLNLGVAADLQPAEDDNGPRLPEVNAEESAKVEDPSQDTATPDGPTGEMKAPTPEETPKEVSLEKAGDAPSAPAPKGKSSSK